MTASYENPARLFLQNHNIETSADVIAYTNFLRSESDISSDPPINLHTILERFSIPEPQFENMPHQQGLIVPNPESYQIIIHSGDPSTRQKFTIAHELIEFLFLVTPNIFGKKKEQICQEAAANLLMPQESFHPKAMKMGLTYKSSELLADEYEVSLMAALCRLIDMYPKQSVMVLWQMKNKPTEFKNEVPKEQIEMSGFHPTYIPAKKLRVAWTYGDYKSQFMPIDKSISEDSSVYTAWKNNQFASGEEIIPFGSYNIKAFIENKQINIKGERHILSLIR